MSKENLKAFQEELTALINKYNLEVDMGNTPDYICAEMIVNIMNAIGLGIYQRSKWAEK